MSRSEKSFDFQLKTSKVRQASIYTHTYVYTYTRYNIQWHSMCVCVWVAFAEYYVQWIIDSI